MLESPAYAFGPFRLIPARRLVLRNGTPVPLTPKAFDTLVTLVERRDRVVSKEELLEQVWEGAAVEEGNLTQQIFLLRKALEDPGIDGRYIATIPRRGYRFVKEVELLPPSSETVWIPPATSQRRSWRAWVFAGGIAAIALAAYLGRGLVESPAPGLTMVLTPMTREPGIESFPSFSPDGREFVYAVGPLDYFGEIDIYRRGVGLDRAFNLTPDSPGADTQPAFSPDGRLIAFRSDRDGGGIFLMRPDGSGVRPLSREGFNPSWSPDGTEVLYATVQTTASPYSNGARRSAVWAVSLQTGARRQVRASAASAPQWSPHGHRIAYWAAGSISTCAPDGSAPVTAVEASDGVYAWNPVWSRDGQYLYFSSNRNGPMHLWRVRIDERSGAVMEPAEPAPVPMPSTFAAHVSFDATGRRLLFASAPLGAAIQRVQFDLAAGELRGHLTALTRGSRGWVWPEPSPDGTRLAFHPSLPDPEEIYVSAADGTDIHALTEGMRARVGRWSPDGRRIAFYSGRGGQANIWIVGSDGRDLRQVTHSSSIPLIFPVWAPDGRLAASESGPGARSFIFNPDLPWDESRNLTLLRDPEPGVHFVPWSWSADGKRLAGFTSVPKGIVVLSLATGTYTRFTSAGSTPVWLPDGRRVLYSVDDRLLLLDTATGRSRELLNVGPARLELAAGGGFSISSAGYIYLAPVTREGDIWLASAK